MSTVDEIAETACAGVGPYEQRVADLVYAVLVQRGYAGAALDSDVHKCIARALAVAAQEQQRTQPARFDVVAASEGRPAWHREPW